MEYEIVTKYGYRFVVNKKGQVLEYSGNGLNKRGKSENELDTWVITGAWYHKGFGHVGFISLEELFDLSGGEDILYKNGKPIYGLTSIDYGTLKQHGNKNVHGVRYIKQRKVS